MATTELTQSAPASAGEKLRRLVEAGLLRLVALWRAARNRRSVVRLLEWDDHMLRDIGLTPGDIRAALSSPIGDDPSYRLGAISRERHRVFDAAAQERLTRQGYFLRTTLPRPPLPPLGDGPPGRIGR
jgi:uncharacterized protein YjiS (DUF1127 family)